MGLIDLSYVFTKEFGESYSPNHLIMKYST